MSSHEDAVPVRRRRGLRRIVGGVVLLVLLAGGAAGGYVWSLQRTVDANLQRAPEAFPSESLRPPAPAETAEGESSPINVLLLGSDRRTGAAAETVSGQRSDVMMLAHLSGDRRRLDVVSFPRDSWVEVPGHGMRKINAAFAFGGFPLAVQTVEQLTGVRIDHVAAIDMQGLKDMTTAVGGVDVDVTQPFTDPVTGYRFDPGTHHIEGDVALGFVRQRKQLERGDLDRVSNQQQLLQGLLSQALSRETLTDPEQLSNFLSATTQHMTVDATLGAGPLRELAWQARGIRADDMSFLTAPVSGLGTSPDGQSIVELDQAKLEQLAGALRSDDMAQYQP